MAEISSQRLRLGNRLRELRAREFRSGSALARELGWVQTRVSKLERGVQLPSVKDLEAWAAAVGAGEETVEELRDLLAAARIEQASWSALYSSGSSADWQARIGEQEAEAAVIREYAPSMLPGIIQTATYAREALSAPAGPLLTGATPAAIDGMVAARVKRQELLYQDTTLVRVLLGEAALRMRFGSMTTLLGQLDRLVALAGLPTVELAVLPESDPSPLLPLAAFSIHDEDTLWVETLTNEWKTAAPDDVQTHVAAFDLAFEAAATGDDAVALIQRVAANLQGELRR